MASAVLPRLFLLRKAHYIHTPSNKTQVVLSSTDTTHLLGKHSPYTEIDLHIC
ncbi:Uncharacterized protein DAT39_011662, partial [Clarias magur]